ncbi:MAG: DUF87 domain-containing protein, partial [Candidatus Micrarchaeota archaeon]|nr:DUF87 domain-containing protein [Candidatus Micrarchaeota archaeon]
DSTYYKVVYATGYPYQVNLGWLSNIVDGREDYDLTMYIYPVSIPEALSTFRGAILKLSTEKKARADFLDPETEQHLEDVKSFFTQIVSGKEKYFLASLYITCKASSPKQLDTVLEKCKSDLAGASIDYEVADYDMAKAVYATRLTGSDLPAKRREFPSSSLAATFPHISSSIEIDPEGMFFAFDWMNAPIIMDLRKLPNQHIAITGESGSGKSYFAKSLIPRYLIGGYRVFVTDPDGEYIDLAGRFNGTVSTVGPHGAVINPFDLEGREVNDKIRSLLGLMAIITGAMTKYQEGLVADVLAELFKASGRRGRAPTFSDFARALSDHLRRAKDEEMRHDLQFMLIAIRPFLRGQLYGFVDAQTSVSLGARLQVFDLRAYQNDKTLRDFFNYLIFDYISHQLLSDKTPKALLMDEGWTMVNYPSSEDYVRYIIKDSRKYNVSFVFITQELEDMLSSPAGRSILNNTATQFVFHQKDSAMALMRTTMNLTHEENEKLIACGKGEGLMISEPYRLLFRVHTSPAEHAVISTDPNEPRAAPGAGGKAKPKVPLAAGAGVGQPVWKQIEASEPGYQKAESRPPGRPGEGAGAAAKGASVPSPELPAGEMDEKEALRLDRADAARRVEEAEEKDAAKPPAQKAPQARAPAARPAALPIALSHGLVNGKDAKLLEQGVERAKARALEMGREAARAERKATAVMRRKGRRAPRPEAKKPKSAPAARRQVKKGRATKKAARSPPRKPAAKAGFSVVFGKR